MIIYAFFHQTTRDESFFTIQNGPDSENNLDLLDSYSNIAFSNESKGQIKIKLKYEESFFKIMVFYARYLVLA